MYKQTEINSKYINQDYINNSEYLTKFQNFIRGSFSIFMPSHIVFTEEKKNKKYFCTKGNDLAYEAIIRFIRKYPNTKFVLRDEGVDRDLAKKILEPIKNHIMYTHTLNKIDHINLMSMFDVIIDNIKLNTFGGISLEASSIGKPVLIDPPNINFYKKDKYPFLQNKTSNQIYSNLERLYKDINFRKNYAEKCKNWVHRNHSKNEFFKLGEFLENVIKKNRISFKEPNNGGYFN